VLIVAFHGFPILLTNVSIVPVNRQLSLSSLSFQIPHSQSLSNFTQCVFENMLSKPRKLIGICQYV
jgi:hypothetical protein